MLLADTSTWHHSTKPGVAEQWGRLLDSDQVAICGPVRLEVLYSARSASDYDAISSELDGLHQLPCGQTAIDRALEVQHALAHQGGLHHRSVKLVDLLIAAVAEEAEVPVWHYDEDYDRVSAITGQATRWAAPRGSL